MIKKFSITYFLKGSPIEYPICLPITVYLNQEDSAEMQHVALYEAIKVGHNLNKKLYGELKDTSYIKIICAIPFN